MPENHAIIVIKFTNGRIMTYCDPEMSDGQAAEIRDQIIDAKNNGRALDLPNLVTILGQEISSCTIAHGTCSEEGIGVYK